MKAKFFLPLIIILAIAAVTAGYFLLPDRDKAGVNGQPTGGTGDEKWVIYRNDTYRFEIRHPADWVVSIRDEDFEPKINIYPGGQVAQLPLTHHSNAAQ